MPEPEVVWLDIDDASLFHIEIVPAIVRHAPAEIAHGVEKPTRYKETAEREVAGLLSGQVDGRARCTRRVLLIGNENFQRECLISFQCSQHRGDLGVAIDCDNVRTTRKSTKTRSGIKRHLALGHMEKVIMYFVHIEAIVAQVQEQR